MTIRVHIDRIVLEGLPVRKREGPAVKLAVEKELARLFAEGGIPPVLAAGGAYPDVPGGKMTVSGTSPREIGTAIARSVYGGMGR
jgi:hypothetical protein